MTIRVHIFGTFRAEKKKNALTSVLFLRTEPKILFDFDLSADFLELGLDVLGLFFGYALFDFRRYAFDQLFGFFQAQSGNGTYDLNHGDFASAGIGQYDIEFSLFFSSSGSTTTTSARHCSHSNRCSGGNSELFFQFFNDICSFHQSQVADCFDKISFLNFSHELFLLSLNDGSGRALVSAFFFLFCAPSFEKLGDLTSGSVEHTENVSVRRQHEPQNLGLKLRQRRQVG